VKDATARLLAGLALIVGILPSLGIGASYAQSGNAKGPALGRIILIEPKVPKGALKVQQARGIRPVNGAVGMLISRGYLLKLNPRAKATVICGDGKVRELGPGPHGVPCTTPCTPEVCGIRYGGSTIGATRGPDSGSGAFPVVISPRKTMLRNLRPAIRWAPIAGANENTSYKVTLYGDGMVIWSKEIASANMLIYPDDEPPLTPGRIYKVVVTSGGLSSEDDRSPDLGFTTLTTDQARALSNTELKKKLLRLPEPQTRFLVSNLYAARELYSEAIEQLQDLYTTMKEPAVVRTLGDLYAMIGLNREAEELYLETLSLTPANDLEGVGATQRSLAQVYENLGTLDRAIARLKYARRAYQQLRNWAIVKALLKDERRLKKLRGKPVTGRA
jgi:hypothetical protein